MNKQLKGADQSIEELQERYNQLHTRKIQAETNLKNAEQSLDKLKTQAREKYGTDDLEALQKKLAEMKEENDQKRKDYQQSLDKIEKDLCAVDQKFSDSITNET